MASVDSPIPLSELESVLAWVDTFKLSRPTRKINRDFSDAVLLAEILGVHYPKLVEMHNYPPRNSQALKLNNWMTLNRKVLKKLKLNLCVNTLEQLANCAPGVIERVLVMVREKIHRDEELNKHTRDAEQNMSSGGSYYEAIDDEGQILIIPVKTRVNGVLETVQQKMINYATHTAIKEELKDAKESSEVLKQKVNHLSEMLKIKEERIDELQKQLERKQSRRKEAETLQNSLSIPFEPLSPVANETVVNQISSFVNETMNKPLESSSESSEVSDPSNQISESKSNETIVNEINVHPKINGMSLSNELDAPINVTSKTKSEDSKIPVKIPSKHSISEVTKTQTVEPVVSVMKTEPSMKNINSQPSISEVTFEDVDPAVELDRVKSDVFKEAEAMETVIIGEKPISQKYFISPVKNSTSNTAMSIEDTIIKELNEITQPNLFAKDYSYLN